VTIILTIDEKLFVLYQFLYLFDVGVEADTRLKRLVAKIGGTIVDIADMAGVTHVVTISSLKRTPKMLVALNLGACYIVGVNWLEDSANQSAPIAIDLASHSKSAASSPKKKSRGGSSGRGNHNEVDYLIHDHDRKWDPFNIVDTLNRNYKRVHAVDGGGTRLFDGLGIFIASDVFGNRAPSKDEMRMVVESGGGIFLVRPIYVYYVIANVTKHRYAYIMYY
jgi:hypothetical protein